MAGARQGTYMTMLTNWDHRLVQDFDALAEIWESVKDSDPRLLGGRVADDLHSHSWTCLWPYLKVSKVVFSNNIIGQTGTTVVVMVREIDVIRQQEGW
jgi:hypothetical protein